MSIKSDAIWAACPTTTRGQPTPLSSDAKGERIAYASNKSIFVRSIDHPQDGRQYTQHTSQTTVARFSPSGFYVASGDVSGMVRVWDCQGEGATKGEYHIIAGRITDIAWDGDSQRIIAVGEGKERFGHCISADSGNTVGEISGQSATINCVSIRQQRPLRAATGSDDTTLAFYHGAPFKYNTSIRGKHNKFVYGTAFSPDGNLLVSVGGDRRIWLYDGKTGEPKQQIGEGAHTGSIFGVAWSADSTSFVTASADQTVKIWDAEVGKTKQSWRMGGDGVSIPHQQVGVTWPHGRSDGIVISVDLEGRLNYLDQNSEKPMKVVQGHQKNITAFAVGSEKTLWSGSSDGRIRAWDVDSGSANEIDGDGHRNYIVGLSTEHQKARIHSIGWDDRLLTIDASAKTFLGTSASTSGQPQGIATASDGTTWVTTGSTIDAYKSDASEKSSSQKVEFSPSAIAASADGKVLAVGSSSQPPRVQIFSVNSTSLTPTSSITTDLTALPTTLAFSPEGSHLAVGTSSGPIFVFKASGDSYTLVTSRWSSHSARVTSLAWSADGRYAVSGSLDTNVHVWTLATPGKRIKAGNAHKDGVSGVGWTSEANDTVVSVGADAAVKLWKVEGLS